MISELLKDRFRTCYVNAKNRYDRGFVYINVIKQPLMAVTMLKIFNLPVWTMVIFVPLWFVVVYTMGWLDQFKLRVWQKEIEWHARQINPYQQELLERIKNIERRVDNEDE